MSVTELHSLYLCMSINVFYAINISDIFRTNYETLSKFKFLQVFTSIYLLEGNKRYIMKF